MIARQPRIAGAPITWGVCEVPGWGWQLGADRVLREAAGLGLRAIELGPRGFLPEEPDEVARTLERYDLRLAAGFVPVVLHRQDARDAALRAVRSAAVTLRAAGAELLILAAELGNGGYERSAELSDAEWRAMFDGLTQAREVAETEGLSAALHPHYGTAVVTAEHVRRVLEGSDIPLCIDTGHLLVGGADPVDVVRAANGRVSHVHFKDVDAALAARVRTGAIGYRDAVAQGLYRPLGDGDVDVAAVVHLLEGAGYAGWYVLEQDVVLDREPEAGRGPAADAARSVNYLKGLIRA